MKPQENNRDLLFSRFCRKSRLVLLWVLFAGRSFALHGETLDLSEEERAWLAAHGSEITIGVHQYPPLLTREAGGQPGFSGISVDYMRFLERRLKIKFHPIESDSWAQLLEKVKSGSLDMVFAIQGTGDRESFLLFTRPYVSLNNHIVGRQGFKMPETLDQLAGKRVAVVRASALYDHIAKLYPTVKLIPVDDELSAMAHVSTGEVDCSVGEISRVSFYMKRELFSNLALGRPTAFRYDFRFGIRKDLPLLRSALDKGLREISSAEQAAIADRWVLAPQKHFFEKPSFWIATAIASAVLSLIVIASWNLSLRRLVRKRTKLLEESERNHLRARQDAEESSRAKSEFLASMSHEIRTPMNAIIGASQILREMDHTEKQWEFLHIIDAAGSTLLSLISDILDMSRIEAGKLDLKMSVADLHKVIEDAQVILYPAAQARGLELLLEIPHALPTVLADETRLKQVLLNLGGNALKFTDQGAVTFAAMVLEETETSVSVEITVRDTGIGIPQDKIALLFMPFVQVRQSGRTGPAGAGLGLAISQKIVEHMGGKLNVKSIEGHGSEFSTRLSFEKATEVNSVAATSGFVRQGLRILLAEDTPVNQIIAEALLTGQKVTLANNGQEAVDWMRKEIFDVVLMDIQMPVMDGFAACRMIRDPTSGVLNTRTPIVGLTAFATPEAKEECLQVGMNGYVTKPVTREALVFEIEKALNSLQ